MNLSIVHSFQRCEKRSASVMTTRSPLAERLAAAWRTWQARRRRDAQRREFDSLDERTLRDLGVSRGEFDSWHAEAEARIERTRRRIGMAP